MRFLSESVLAANKQINTLAPGSGTTLTALLILGKQLFLAHVGDSRAYTYQPRWRNKNHYQGPFAGKKND